MTAMPVPFSCGGIDPPAFPPPVLTGASDGAYEWLRPGSPFVESLCPDLIQTDGTGSITPELVATLVLDEFQVRAAAVLAKLRHHCRCYEAGDLTGDAMVRMEDAGIANRFDPSRPTHAGAVVYATMVLLLREHMRLCRRWQLDRTPPAFPRQPMPQPDELAIFREQVERLGQLWPTLTEAQQQALCRKHGPILGTEAPEPKLRSDSVNRLRGRERLGRHFGDEEACDGCG